MANHTMGTGSPWAALAGVTLQDPEVSLLAPPSGYERWLCLRTVPAATGMTDHQALDYAEALGFTPEMFAQEGP